jgi:hypothetical protein
MAEFLRIFYGDGSDIWLDYLCEPKEELVDRFADMGLVEVHE